MKIRQSFVSNSSSSSFIMVKGTHDIDTRRVDIVDEKDDFKKGRNCYGDSDDDDQCLEKDWYGGIDMTTHLETLPL